MVFTSDCAAGQVPDACRPGCRWWSGVCFGLVSSVTAAVWHCCAAMHV